MAFPGIYNINYYKGDTLNFDIFPKGSDQRPFSMVGYTAEFTIATARGSSATQYQAEAVINQDSISCYIHPDVGGQLNATSQYVYDVQISKPAPSPSEKPTIYTVLTGTISVRDHVTGAVL